MIDCRLVTIATLAICLLATTPGLAGRRQDANQSGGGGDLVGLTNKADCAYTPLAVCRNCTSRIRLAVKQNGFCPINVRSLGPIAGVELLTRPQNGSFAKADESSIAYRPKAGFLGYDRLAARVYFESGDGNRTFMILQVGVRVHSGHF
jgi:hypothetical protein